QGNGARRWDQLMRQFDALRSDLQVQLRHTSDIAARSVEAVDEAEPHRIAVSGEDDRNRVGCGLGREGTRSGRRSEYAHPTLDQIGEERWQPIVPALCPTKLDRNVAALHIAAVAQALAKSADQVS